MRNSIGQGRTAMGRLVATAIILASGFTNPGASAQTATGPTSTTMPEERKCSAMGDVRPTGGPVHVPLPTADELRTSMLSVINEERGKFGVEPVTWDNNLAADSQIWANTLIGRRGSYVLEHDGNRGSVGEIISGGGDASQNYTAKQLANYWVNEGAYFRDGAYVEGTGSFSTTCHSYDVGHYSQMVWRNSTRVGCAIGDDRAEPYRGTGRILVCRFKGPGNVPNERAYPAGRKPWAAVLSDTPSAPAVLAAPPAQTAEQFRAALLGVNNQARGGASRAALTWDTTLAAQAQIIADRRGAAREPMAEIVSDSIATLDWNKTAEDGFRNLISPQGTWYREFMLGATLTKVGCGMSTQKIGENYRRIVVCNYS